MSIDLERILKLANGQVDIRLLSRTKLVVLNREPQKLKNETLSIVYVNGRNDVTEDPQVLALLGSWILQTAVESLPADERRKIIFMGVPTAGQPLAVAASLARVNHPLSSLPRGYRTVRERPKGHGLHTSYVDGNADPTREVYVLVDNVVTDGGSKREFTHKLGLSGYPAKDILHVVLVDRQQGAVEELRRDGFRVATVLNLLDLVRAYEALGAWTSEQREAVEREIASLRK